jgi:hypothetical protein
MDDDQKELLKISADAALKPFADLMQQLFGGPLGEIGGMWQDSLKVRREIRKIDLLKKVQKKLDEAAVEPRSIPDRIWLPVMQAALMEDDDTLQDKWASLLANAADPRDTTPVLPSFAAILGEIITRDAVFLDALHKRALESTRPPRSKLLSNVIFHRSDLLEIFAKAGLSRTQNLNIVYARQYQDNKAQIDTDLVHFELTLTTLVRHGLVAVDQTANMAKDVVRSKSAPTDPYIELPQVVIEQLFCLSELGISFVRACQAPSAE